MPLRCRLFGHIYYYRSNPLNGLCERCGWFEFGPNPNAHTKEK